MTLVLSKFYCAAVFDGTWKLMRYYGLADVSHSAIKDMYSLGERLDDQ